VSLDVESLVHAASALAYAARARIHSLCQYFFKYMAAVPTNPIRGTISSGQRCITL
jgi:hypothetical protein